jgi:hypothetical protein
MISLLKKISVTVPLQGHVTTSIPISPILQSIEKNTSKN